MSNRTPHDMGLRISMNHNKNNVPAPSLSWTIKCMYWSIIHWNFRNRTGSEHAEGIVGRYRSRLLEIVWGVECCYDIRVAGFAARIALDSADRRDSALKYCPEIITLRMILRDEISFTVDFRNFGILILTNSKTNNPFMLNIAQFNYFMSNYRGSYRYEQKENLYCYLLIPLLPWFICSFMSKDQIGDSLKNVIFGEIFYVKRTWFQKSTILYPNLLPPASRPPLPLAPWWTRDDRLLD